MLLIIPAKPQLGEKEETREAVGAPGGDQGQAGWGPGQPDLVGGHTSPGGWKRMLFKVPPNPSCSTCSTSTEPDLPADGPALGGTSPAALCPSPTPTPHHTAGSGSPAPLTPTPIPI